MENKRNPKWQRDELILALDLYLKLEPGQIHARNPLIVELSDILNRLPIHGDKDDYKKFRNANGVGLKLSNFLALDETYSGKGMAATSKLDKEVFAEFKDKKKLLGKLASAIKLSAINPKIRNEILNLDDDIDDYAKVKEGGLLYRYHLARERNSTIVKKKKEKVLKLHGKLESELCSFDFEKVYGKIGYGFIECHHKQPLYTLFEETETSIDDLMLVCSNCHRMLHRGLEINNTRMYQKIMS